jgi:hypothetical protein
MDCRNKLHGNPFQPSLMLVGKARSLPQNGAPERCFTQIGSGLTRKYYTRLERLAMDKHTSLLRNSVNYDRENFIVQAPGKHC